MRVPLDSIREGHHEIFGVRALDSGPALEARIPESSTQWRSHAVAVQQRLEALHTFDGI
jgi:hypothetical protein